MAYILYTSGTTGKPKGVSVTNANVCHYVRAFCNEFHPACGDIMGQNALTAIFLGTQYTSIVTICSFGLPKLLVPEDPVCSSAHCQIADFWSKELGKTEIHAYQASKRGGHLYCKLLENGRIKISGEATLVAISDIAVDF